MFASVSKQVLLVVLRHGTVRLHKVETIVIFAVLGHSDTSGDSSTRFSSLTLHPFEGIAFGAFGNAFRMGTETSREHFWQHIKVASRIAINRFIGSLYVHGRVRPFDISLKNCNFHVFFTLIKSAKIQIIYNFKQFILFFRLLCKN